MSFSNIRTFQLLTFTLSVVGLFGCWSPTQVGPQGGATFVVEEAKGGVLPSQEVQTDWKFPEVANVYFTACIRDRAQNSRVPGGQDFEIQGGVSIERRKTDNSGCVTWNEPLSFNFFAKKSQYVIIERTIKGLGVHSGTRPVRFAVNPWGSFRGASEKDVLFVPRDPSEMLPGKSFVEGAKVLSALRAEGQEQPQLWMYGLSAHITKISDTPRDSDLKNVVKINPDDELNKNPNEAGVGSAIELALEMDPSVLLYDSSGNMHPYNLKGGRFRVYAQIIATNLSHSGDEKLVLTPNLPSQVGTILEADGKLRVPLVATLSRRVSKGRLELAVKVVPVDGPNLQPFEGLYLLGEFDQLRQRSSPMLRPEVYAEGSSFNYDNYVRSASNFEVLKKAGLAFAAEPFDFSTMDIRYEAVQPGETATTRTIEFRVKTCLTDTYTGVKIRDEKFYIKQNGGNFVEAITNEEGCLVWVGQQTHKYYAPEELYFQDIEILYRPKGGKEYRKNLRLAVNPWDEGWTFARDYRVLVDDYIKSLQRRKKVESRFFIGAYGYQTLRFRYEIDEFMNLKVKKTVLLNLYPRVLRYSSIVLGRRATEQLRDGIYLMKVALQKDYLDPAAKGVAIDRKGVSIFDEKTQRDIRADSYSINAGETTRTREFISVVKKLVRVQDGRIITPVEFGMRDLRLMRIRSQFLIQLETIDESLLQIVNRVDEKLGAKINNSLNELQERRELGSLQRREQLSGDEQDKIEDVQTRMAERETLLLTMVERLKRAFRKGSSAESEEELSRIFRDYGITEEDLAVLYINDFTVNPATAPIDYDRLVDPESGLKARTFIGPMTLILNANSNEMRPTDNLDESACASDDCNQLAELANNRYAVDNTEYEHSPFYGSVRRFINTSVDDLIKRKRVLEDLYYKENEIRSSLYNFAKAHNLHIVSFDPTVPKKFKEGCTSVVTPSSESEEVDRASLDAAIERCLEPAPEIFSTSDQFLEQVNQMWGRGNGVKLNRQDLLTIAREGRATKSFIHAFCQRWVNDIAGKRDPHRPITLTDGVNPLADCITRAEDVMEGADGEGPIIFDRKIRVRRTGDYRYRGGKSMNINVGATFSMSRNEAASFHFGFDFLGWPFIDTLAGYVLLHTPKLNINRDVRIIRGEGTTIAEQTFLVMQMANLDIELKSYEYCTVVRMNPLFLEEMQFRNWADPILSEEELFKVATRGYMICTGRGEDQIRPIRERYYYFTQHFTEGDMLDPGDLYNHPWLLALRGVRDFRTFILFIRNIEANGLWAFFKPIVTTDQWPIAQLVRAYTQVLPSFPGLFTIMDEKEEEPDYPFSSDPLQSFSQDIGIGINPALVPTGDPDGSQNSN